jgi:hypothetical protein
MVSFEGAPASEREWYEKARHKAELVLRTLDPDMRVEVNDVDVIDHRGNRRETLALRFSSALNWTMEIDLSDDYIENRLPSVITQIYEERTHRAH